MHANNLGQSKSLTGFSFKVLVASLVLGIVVFGAILFVAGKREKIQRSQQEQAPPLSEEEKKKILESLSAPSEAQYSPEEKNKILETLKAQNP